MAESGAKFKSGRIEGVDQEAALAARQRHPGEPVALRRVGMDEALGGLDQLVEAAHADHALAGRDRIKGFDRAGKRAGVRHCCCAAALGSAEFQRDHRFAGGACGLAGFAEDFCVPHALQIHDDDPDRRIGGEIGHQVRGFEPGLVAGRDHVADADAAILQRLADRHHDRAGLAGDCDRSLLHGDDAVVDIGEEVFAGAEIAETIRTGHRESGFLHRLLQFDGEPLAFRVLQFGEARGDDGGRACAGRGRIADHLHGKARRHQHQHMVGLFGEAREILVTGHAPDRFAFRIDREQPAAIPVFDQVDPDALGVIAWLVGGADQHDVARVQHRMNALDDATCVWRGRPLAGVSVHECLVPSSGLVLRDGISALLVGLEANRSFRPPSTRVAGICHAQSPELRWESGARVAKEKRGSNLRWSPSTVEGIAGYVPQTGVVDAAREKAAPREITCCRRARCARRGRDPHALLQRWRAGRR